MPRRKDQKGKLLKLLKILWRESDEQHPLSVPKLVERLAEQGVTAERKSIYDDLNVLQQMDYDIVQRKGYGYYLGERQFQLAELKLLVDAVQSSRVITPKKSDALIRKLEQQASVYEASALQRQVILSGQSKSDNESIYYAIDTIHEGINTGRQISFRYFDYNTEKEKEYHHGGAVYQVSPYAMLWDDEKYYMLAYDERSGIIKHYRVDRMERCAVTEERRMGEYLYQRYDMGRYATRHFGMYKGREEDILLRCENWAAKVMIDRFSDDIQMVPMDENHFTLSVRVVVSKQFYGWLVGLGSGVTVLAPESVREELKAYLTEILNQY